MALADRGRFDVCFSSFGRADIKKNVILVAALLAGVCGAASAQLITFEELGTQPGLFLSTGPLRSEYAGQGVSFSGRNATDGGAILNQSGNFGINARSGEHFLAFNGGTNMNNGGVPTGPQTIAFAGGASSVSIYGASGNGTTRFIMQSFDANNTQLGQVIVSASDTWEEISLSGGNIAYVVINADGDDAYVMDDLSWTAIPAPSSMALAGVLALGAARRRR